MARIRVCCTLLFFAGLQGCASLTPEQCLRANWRQIGYSDGTQGMSGARIDDHAKACAEQGIRPDLQEYLAGRTQGFSSYCQPENGFSLGRRGIAHNGADCAIALKPAFLHQYRRGQEIYLIESELGRRRARLGENQHQLRRNEVRIASIKRDLAKTDFPPGKRIELLNEFHRLLDQRNALTQEHMVLVRQEEYLNQRLHFKLREFGR